MGKTVARGKATELTCRLFGSYLFTSFDVATDTWRAINSTRGARRLMCEGERPIAFAEDLLSRFSSGPVADIETALEIFTPGSPLRITKGPFESHIGECLWASARQVCVRLKMFNAERGISFKRDEVEKI